MKAITLVFLGVAVAVSVAAAEPALATIGLPDSETFGIDGICLDIQNTNFGASSTAIRAVGGIKGLEGQGQGTGSTGVFGWSNGDSSYGVRGEASGTTSYGVYGSSVQSVGVYGTTGSASSYAVYGSSSNGVAILGSGSTRGVQGNASGTGGVGVGAQGGPSGKAFYGLVSPAGVGYGIYADNNSTATGAWAGYLKGKLNVTGKAVCPSCTNGLWSLAESDVRLKKDVKTIADGLDLVMQLRPVTFKWKDPDAHGGEAGVQRGFIAQEVEKVLPEWVEVNENGNKAVNYGGLSSLLVESVQRLKGENDALRDRVKALENRQAFATAGLGGNGLLGLGLIGLASAIVVSRRRSSTPGA